MDPNEMEQLQRLSDQYQADLPGPLIGEKLPMTALVTEYAQADPVYVVKTTGLAATHSAYRPIKGDGQCGWRGAVFGYFETLLSVGDAQLVEQETVRLKSFEETMRMVGVDYDILSVMFDDTWDLFEDIRKAVERQEVNEAVILNILNDENRSNSIVYHFKIMTSSWMQLRADQYEPFLDVSLQEYRLRRIDPANQEIDQIGLQALTDGIISPAGIGVEVLYLDRSSGEEVTPHQFAQGTSTITLLYRPGHYDMIYKDHQHLQAFLMQQNLQQPAMLPHDLFQDYSGLNDFLFPGSTMLTQDNGRESNYLDYSSFSSSSELRNISVTASEQGCPFVNPHFHQTRSTPKPQLPSSTSNEMGKLQHRPKAKKEQLSSQSNDSAHSSTTGEPQIRLNENVFTYNYGRHESIPLDLEDLRSSATSPAHFLNADFQPLMWNAKEEYRKNLH